MALQLRVRRLAEQDLGGAYRWYQRQRHNLGIEFLHAIDDCFDRVMQNPHAYPLIRGAVRRALVRRFPFCIYFLVTPAEIVVLAVLHARRSEQHWQSRSENR